MKLEEPKPMDRVAVLTAFQSSDELLMCRALLSATYFDERQWVEAHCRRFLDDPTVGRDVRQLAATCLGHLARLHHNIDPESIELLLRIVRLEPELGTAREALNDIHIFVKPNADHT